MHKQSKNKSTKTTMSGKEKQEVETTQVTIWNSTCKTKNEKQKPQIKKQNNAKEQRQSKTKSQHPKPTTTQHKHMIRKKHFH